MCVLALCGCAYTAGTGIPGHITTVAGDSLISNALINAAGAFIDATVGTLTLTPDLQNFGTITNSATISVGSSSDGTVTNTGNIIMAGGRLLSGTVTNAGVINGEAP